ncbi:B- and T-lymphocyte attenuator-like isoform X1 [Sander vitreus]
MDRPAYTHLWLFSCFTFVCIYGRGQDLIPLCEVELMVQRGTTWKTVPQQRLTVSCPVKHCGESMRVTWCKRLDTNKCEQINYTENVEITQNDKHVKDKLISYLNFTRISINDSGLYQCLVKGYKYQQISHFINISVSDLNQDVENSDNNAHVLPILVAGDKDVSWLPYFFICAGIALLFATLTASTHLSCYCWKRILTYKQSKTQEMSTHMIPDLPNGSAPSAPVLYDSSYISYSQSAAGRPPSPSPLMTNGNQPAVANTVNESQVFDHAVYAVINHRRIPAREQHAATEQNKNTEYAAQCFLNILDLP